MTDKYVEHLQGLVRIPTVSCEDPKSEKYAPFDELHRYLEKTYPCVHRTMEKKVFGRAGLLFRWKGKDSSKNPMILMAHQDVVPVGDEEAWTHPPFCGDVIDGELWGRGAVDCKDIILGGMEAAETLISEGFVPECDVYFSYGCNEEISAPDKTAALVVSYFQKNGIVPGLVIDEGIGLNRYCDEHFDGYLCNINLGEKARAEIEIYAESEGGHAMEPGGGSALGVLAGAIVAVEKNPMPYRLTELVKNQIKAMALSAPEGKKYIYDDPETYFDELCSLAEEDKKIDSLLHTTIAVTMAHGSDQSNVLPRRASAVIDCRILEGDTIESVVQHIMSVVPNGIKVRYDEDVTATGSSVVGSRAFLAVKEAVEKVYGNVHMIPGLLGGGTDSRYFQAISTNVFRAGLYVEDERWGKAHSVDEKIPCDCLESGIRCYYELIKCFAS